jgi:uncharacterized metal-binding protein
MDCTVCQTKSCRQNQACPATASSKTELLAKYSAEAELLKAAASLVDNGRAGTLSRLQEISEFSKRMGYRRLGLAYCYGMEKQAQQIVSLLRADGLQVRAVSCTVGGLPQNEVIPGSAYQSVSCNPIGQAAQLNHERVDLVLTMGLCLGHDILFQREIQADCTALVVKDRVFNHDPLRCIEQ